jgi:hypothetical protein
MNKFTPGPWFVVEDMRDETDGVTFIAGYDVQSDRSEIIGCEGINGDSAENLANAQLISAAPDLLEALELYMEAGHGNSTHFGDQAGAYCKAVAAIAKARGEA